MSLSYNAVRDKIRNKTRVSGVKADVLYRRFLIERFIARIAASEHNGKVIIKGGMLLSAIAGIDMRSTQDLDATIRGNSLTISDFERIVKDVIQTQINDDVIFEFIRADEIMQDSSYPCCRVRLRVLFGTMDERVDIDVTTGDVITPREVVFGFPTLFGGEKIPILAYTLETVLSEKISALLDLGVYNTRAKDFYDLYLITATQSESIDKTVLTDALRNTLRNRGKLSLLSQSGERVSEIVNNADIQKLWSKYRREFSYASDIDFNQVAEAISKLFNWMGIDINIHPHDKADWFNKTLADGKRKADEYNRNNPPPSKRKKIIIFSTKEPNRIIYLLESGGLYSNNLVGAEIFTTSIPLILLCTAPPKIFSLT